MAACLDSLPNLGSNCFKQYIQNAANYELYSCRDKHLQCEKPAGENCIPLNPMNDFYIPILSFGKHLCNENELQMQDSTSVNNTSDKESETENYEKSMENTMLPTYSISSSSEDTAFHLDETESDISTTTIAAAAANTEDLYFESVTSTLNLNAVLSTPSIHPYHEDDAHTQTSYIVKESISDSGIACCSSYLIFVVIVLVFI
ncbi:hypothetical protein CEXT_334671 [Caerostris extrusa]|uniref:Uncharacterized protein n=1 Tax=Caerostris extrusa TaxID=172846 RepID=A0AAV4VYR0_CAEEX|nr:hypothetical protein CEXT_334671 [Caerostris extrusa]